ncbi:MAG: SUMF1/EgtB/PvdO family nonheme iron enzyme [Elusimicrobia bacterium]|nr:SUMF1/EgtB/PvdO family nonheme iron enzyme [Elusimicrobiota bacterium]
MRQLISIATMIVLSSHGAAWAPWPDISKPAPAVGGGSGDAAVIVGIEKYAIVSPIEGAKANALAWYDYLNKTRGVPAGNIFLLRDNEAIAESMKDYAAQAAGLAKEGGILWFVFIGHGAPDAETKDGLLVAWDAQQTAVGLKSRSFRQKDLLLALSKSKAQTIAVVLDACFSGKDEGGRELVKGLQPIVNVAPASSMDARFAVLSAARADEFAGRLPGVERPAFSYLALGALRGWADSGSDRNVTAGKIQDYAAQAFRATVRDRSQHPTVMGNADAVLGRSAGEKGPDLGEMAKAETPAAGGGIEFKVSALPEVPRANAPSSAAFGGVPRAHAPGELAQAGGIDFGSVDVDALEKYDVVVKFEKGEASAVEKAAKWRELGKAVKAYADTASKRALEWDDFAADAAFNAALEDDKSDAAAEQKAAIWRAVALKAPKHAQAAQKRAQDWDRYAEELRAAEEARARRAEIRDKDWQKLKRLLALSVVGEEDKRKFALTFVKAYGKTMEDNPYMPELLSALPEGFLSAAEIKALKRAPKAAAGRAASSGEMVFIPAGEFWMGSPDGEGGSDEHPRHKVYLDAFYMDKFDVTAGDYAACVAAGKCSDANTYSGCSYKVSGREKHPINCVDWNQAKAYCEWKGKRLPTEAEWERAARGGTETKYYFGNDESQLREYAWYSSNSGGQTHPVGEKKPNPFGLYDMHGNVWQWVADWYDEGYYGNSPNRNPKGPNSGQYRSLRGGSWNFYPDYLRAALRPGLVPGDGGFGDGFRCARSGT